MKFEELLGIAPEIFFKEHFEDEIVFSKTDLRFEKLERPLENWDEALLEKILIEGTVTLVKDSLKVGNDFFVTGEGKNLSKLFWLHGDGFTFYLKEVERFFPELDEFICKLEKELYPYKIQTNLFISPEGSIGFQPHFDCHDVIVCQVSGKKNWRLWEAYRQDMTEERPNEEDINEVEKIVFNSRPSVDRTLDVGDVFYMPRGVIHAPRAVGRSTHLTFWLKAPLLKSVDTCVEDEYEKRRENYLHF